MMGIEGYSERAGLGILAIAAKAALLWCERADRRSYAGQCGAMIIEFERSRGPEPVWHLDIYEATVYGRLHDDEPARGLHEVARG
jgi:hypothetical protein